MKNTLLFFFILIILAACSKDDGMHTWEGKVLEYGTMKAVPGAAVYLIEARGSILGPTIKSVVDSTLSDHNGHFKFIFEFNPYISEISGKAHNYFDGSDVIGTTKNTKKDLILDPYAWVKVNVKNIDPVGDYDGIAFDYGFGCSPRELQGFDLDTSVICALRGNRQHTIKYYSTKTGSASKQKSFDITLGARDTVEYLLEF